MFGNEFDQWNVSTGGAVSATAQNTGIRQAYIGQVGADTFSGGALDDIFLAGAGADVLNGLASADMLAGGAGSDTLDGGTGNDRLIGGLDQDIYIFSGNFGSDTIEEADGSGAIQVQGFGEISGNGAKKRSSTTWQTADGSLTFNLITLGTSQRLAITVGGSESSGNITLSNWSNGQLGINLEQEIEQPPTTIVLFGDYAKKVDSSDPDHYLMEGANYARSGVQVAAADVLSGTQAADGLQGLRRQ